MGRRHTNEVHNYFSFDEQWNVSKCHICNNGVKGKHGTNLLRHLSTRHPNVFSQVKFVNNTRKSQDNSYDGSYNTIAKINDTFSVRRNEEFCRSITLLNECVKLVTIHGRPLALFDDQAFQNIVKLIPLENSDRVQMNSYEIRRQIKQKSQAIREKISDELHKKNVCIKVDVISHLDRTFIGIHAQYINEDIIVLRTLSIGKFDEIISPTSLQLKILETIRYYNISIGQIYSVVTDDFSNTTELAAFWPGIMTGNEDSVNSSAGAVHQELDFKLQEKELRKCETDVKILLVPRDEHMLPRQRIKQEIDVANVSTANCITVQNFSYMVTAVKCIASVLDEAIINAHNIFNENGPRSQENEASGNDADSMYPTQRLRNRLLTEHMTCGDFYGAWMTCLLETEKINTPLASEVTKSLRIEQKRLFRNPAFLAAMYLDPRFNIVLSPEEIEKARSQLNTTWVHMLKINSLSVPVEEESISDEDEIEIMLRQMEHAKKSKYPHTNEKSGFNVEQMTAAILGFTNQHRVKSKENVLEFWQSQKISNPYLYKLAMTVLAVPTTHVSAKIMIPSVKFILSTQELDEELLNSILLIRCNKNI